MTSQINPNNIDGNYPVPGVPNNTQGFRSNFTETKTNFQYAAQEITELQTKAILKAPITGSVLNNNMNDQLIYAVKLQDVSYTYVPVAATSGPIVIDYAAAQYQQINVAGNVSLSFANFPTAGAAGSVRVAFNITNPAYTVTLPAAVNTGITVIEGAVPGTAGVTNVISFGSVGNYAFEFASVDAGTSIWIFDQSRPTTNVASRFRIANTTPATSSTTGAFNVVGGVGVAGNVFAGGNVTGNYLFGDGGFLSNVTVVSNVAVSQIGNGSSTVAVNGSGGNITFTAGGVANVAVITPAGVQFNGNIVGDTNFAGNVTAGAGSYFLGDGSLLSNISPNFVFFGNSQMGFGTNNGNANISVGSSVNVAVFTSAASIFNSNVIAGNDLVVLGNATANNITITNQVIGNLTTTGSIRSSSSGGVGYTVGAGGAQTQSSNKSTPVTLNTITGQITINNQNLAADATASFVLNSTAIANTDVMIINHVSGGTIGAYAFNAACAAGNATISITNRSAGALAEAPVIRFAVIKGSIT
jgi:hypothetical protein